MKPSRTLTRNARMLAGILPFLAFPPLLLAGAAPPDGPEQAQAAAAPPAQGSIAGMHRLAQAIAQLGAPECAPKVHEAAIYLIHDTESGAIAHSRSYDLFSFSLEVIDAEGMTSYLSLNVAPGKNQACAIGYEIVTPVGASCETLAREAWPGALAGSPLRKQMVPLQLEDGQTILLQPVGESCLVIRKEIIP